MLKNRFADEKKSAFKIFILYEVGSGVFSIVAYRAAAQRLVVFRIFFHLSYESKVDNAKVPLICFNYKLGIIVFFEV